MTTLRMPGSSVRNPHELEAIEVGARREACLHEPSEGLGEDDAQSGGGERIPEAVADTVA